MRITFKEPIGFDHIAFGMDSSQETWNMKDKLEAAGFECSDMIDHGFIHSIYSFDPNGIPIEFCYEAKGHDIRKNPVIGDDDPPVSTMEGPLPQPGKWPRVNLPKPMGKREVRSG